MTVGEHYLNEDVAKRILNIAVPSADLDDFIEDCLTLIDHRINQRCHVNTNFGSTTMDGRALASVELNAFMQLIKNYRLTKEGVPSEVAFVDTWFSAEDKFLMQDIREKNRYVAVSYQKDSEL